MDALKFGGTKSCGCLQKEIASELGHKAFQKLPPGVKPANELFYSYKKQARERRLKFELTREEFDRLTRQTCYYCNRKPYTKFVNPRFKEFDFVYYNGLDRINPNEHYTIQNCVSCCKECNYMKMDYSETEFYAIIKRIYEFKKL